MASTFTYLTVSATPSSLLRHWALVVVLSSLLSAENMGIFPVDAEPSMILHAIPAESVPILKGSNANTIAPIVVTPLKNFSFSPNPLVTVPLKDLPQINDSTTLLTINSPNDLNSDNFLIEISNPPPLQRRSLGETIIYAFLGVTVTNLCAVTGFICIPFKRLKHFDHMLNFMMALAVGALFSTAVMVLIPESMRMIDMPLEFGGQGRTYLFKLGCVPAGMLFFVFVEYILLIIPRLLKVRPRSTLDNHSNGLECENWNVSSGSDNGTDIGDMNNWEKKSNSPNGDSNPEILVEDSTDLGDGDSNQIDSVYISEKSITKSRRRCCLHFSRKRFAEIAPVAWMILFGDGFHNFMDGMTIGAGFTESPTIGVALSLSILFEELPHELGDFAVLIASGFSVKSAVCANFLSACSAYLGMILGLVIGEVSVGALYVFAITAGFFLYISLSDMLPNLREALENMEKKGKNSIWLFVIQVGGLVTGFGCVLGVTLISDLISF